MKFFFIFLFGLALTLSACKKEKAPEDEGCIPMSVQKDKFPSPPSDDARFGDSIFSGGVLTIVTHDFNPFDSDEVLLGGRVEDENGNSYSGLYLYNLNTGVRKVLPPLNMLRASPPRWSRKDWLLFTAQSGPQQWDAYKMKSNGDSLTRLTWSGNIHAPEWNWDGDKFICYLGLIEPTPSVIFDENGNPLDTIYAGDVLGSWRHPKGYRAGYIFTGSFRVTHPESQRVIFVLPVDDARNSYMGGQVWIDEENVVWSYEHGVFRTNFVTGETVQLIASCNAILYMWPIYSFETGKLIFRRSVHKAISRDKVVASAQFVTVDPFDGTQEVIEIDGY